MGRLLVSIEKLPSGKYRAVVRHAGVKRAGEAVESAAGSFDCTTCGTTTPPS